ANRPRLPRTIAWRWASIGSSRWRWRRGRAMAREAEPVVWLHSRGKAQTLLAARHALVGRVPPDGASSMLPGPEQSFGALRLAAEQPNRVLALVLAGPAGEPDEALLGAVVAPTLVAFGTDDGSENGRVYREKMSNCHFVLVYAAGRDIARDRPEAF